MLLERNRIPPALRPYYQEWWANTQEDIHAVSKRIEAIARIWDHVGRIPSAPPPPPVPTVSVRSTQDASCSSPHLILTADSRRRFLITAAR